MPMTMVGRPRSREAERYAPDSWWIDSTPDDFTRRAWAEVSRMSNSRMATGVDEVRGLHDLNTKGQTRGPYR